jgi:uncharacterized repeat protein (TIGR01451 family)
VSSAPAQALPGTEVVFTVRLTNPHATELSQANVSAALPAGAVFVSATATQGQPVYQPATNSVDLTGLTLAASQSVDVSLRIQLPATAAAGSTLVVNAGAGVNGSSCVQASGAVTITPAGIPVTGIGPGWEDLRSMVLAGLGLLAVLLVAGWSVSQRVTSRR